MKRYKLKRDLPTFKAGDEFSYINGNLIECKPNGTTGICLYSANTLEKFPNILADWFEEVKEPTQWKPVPGDTYWSLDGIGYVNYYESSGGTYTSSRVSIGNCFKTKEEAEQVVEYLKALAVVRGDATTEFIKGKDNYYVVYNATYNCLDISDNSYLIKNGVFGLPYFATREDALRSIELHKKEWLTIFGIEEENETKK